MRYENDASYAFVTKIRDYKTGRLRKPTDLDETRIRFNWGYHDGAGPQGNSFARPDGLNVYTIQEKHFDPAYAEGWVRGYRDRQTGAYTGNSTKAWEDESHRASLTPKYAPYRMVRSD